ncbi:MAG TPA: hydantoinase/oxoprolinase family protein [Chloroflexota bacterium]|nr:hydantoinase/oxoprolinase family protein [Chloroflexota bacterium]
MSTSQWRAGVDIGGTFTDLLLVDAESSRFRVGKVLTTASEPAVGVRAALEAELLGSELPPEHLGTVVHGTTLVTNAVIERKGALTALLITEGFRDTLLIGREHRYDMYDVRLEKPEPLVPRRLTLGVPERVLADGTVHRPLDEAAVAQLGDALRASGVRAVGVCLLHAYRHPQHELRVREILQQRLPELRVALSHEVVGELREYERASTTVANAYVLDVVDHYLGRLERDLGEIGHRGEFLIMLSSGATATPETARRFPVRLMESGPAAGALAAAHLGVLMGRPNLLSFDMGGTTAKACLIEGGRPTIASEFEVARLQRFRKGSGLPIKISSVELIEIGAGGGSIARVDRFGLVKVGPDSSGSEPGPACYGRGGSAPTVTDADLVLGYLDPRYFLGGRMALDLATAERAIDVTLAEPLGLDVARAAWTVHQVVNENMANAARVHAVERGRDARAFPLFAFGGAGPVHAYRVAEKLGVREVIAPFGAGVGSTIGLLAAPLAFDFVRTAAARVRALDWPLVGRLLATMEGEGRDLLRRAGVPNTDISVERAADMRLIGQAHEIRVELPGAAPAAGDEQRLEQAFERTYTGLFGRTPPNVPMEVVSWRVRVAGPVPDLRLGVAGAGEDGSSDACRAIKGERPAYFPELDGFHATTVYDRYSLGSGAELRGPAIVEERESTVVIGPGGRARVDDLLNLVVELA